MDSDAVLIEGYWRKSREEVSDLPWPVGDDNWSGADRFLQALTAVEDGAPKMLSFGFSRCRLCRRPNGSAEFALNPWHWPEGLRHYIREHKVRPTAAFEDFIFAEAKLQIDNAL